MSKTALVLILIFAIFKSILSREIAPAPILPPADSAAVSGLLPFGPTNADYEQKKRSESSGLEQTNPAKLFLVLLINLYQNTFSKLDGSTCQFRPSCYHFGARAIKLYGPLWGTLMTADRLLRCNPFTQGKYPKTPDHFHNLDPVEEHAP
jgi:uncharacterized protein